MVYNQDTLKNTDKYKFTNIVLQRSKNKLQLYTPTWINLGNLIVRKVKQGKCKKYDAFL